MGCHFLLQGILPTLGSNPGLLHCRLTLYRLSHQGMNTRVCCHFLLQGIFLTWGSNPGLLHCRQTLYRLSHQGMNTGVGCYFLLQGIFLTQGSNPGFPHCRQMLYHLSCQGSPRRMTKRSSFRLEGPKSQIQQQVTEYPILPVPSFT